MIIYIYINKYNKIKNFIIYIYIYMYFNRSVYCCGYCYQGVSSEIILYNQLNIDKMQYYSLDPLTINFSKQSEIWSKNDTIELDSMDSEKKEYLKKLKKKIAIHAQYIGTDQPDDMELLLAQVNILNYV